MHGFVAGGYKMRTLDDSSDAIERVVGSIGRGGGANDLLAVLRLNLSGQYFNILPLFLIDRVCSSPACPITRTEHHRTSL